MSTTPVRLAFRLLGAPEVRSAGLPLVLHHQKAQALLYYLAATALPQTREHLAALLWSDVPEDNARHSLRSNLYVVRRTLQACGAVGALVVEGPYVHLDERSVVCDVVDFRRLLQEDHRQALAEAVALYRGPLLQGFLLSGAPLFEDWLRTEGAALEQACLAALRRLAALAEQDQCWEEAIAYLQRSVQLDPFSEEEQRHLIELYLRAGAPGRAWRQYTQYERLLQQEYGLAPSEELRARARAALTTLSVAEGRSARREPQLSSISTRPFPFVGREQPLQHLLALCQEVAEGQGTAVLVLGEDGSGKTRLLDELVRELGRGGPPWLVLRGSCSPFDELLAYGPFLEALQGLGLDDLMESLAPLPERAPDEQGHFMWRLWQTLRTLAQGAPLLLAIDDLHWANSATLQLFGFLALRARHLPLMLVGTSAAVGAIPALQRLLAVGRRHGALRLLPLAPLTQEAVEAFVQALQIVTVPTTSTFTAWLYERCGGSPFILIELIRQLQTAGVLGASGEGFHLDVRRWLRWRALHALPETAYDLVMWRLVDLPPAAHTLLEVLAVAQQALPLALLQVFPGLRAAPLLTLIEDLLERGLLSEAGADACCLAHPLLREAVIHRLNQPRCQQIHRDLAAVLEDCPAFQKAFPCRQIALHAVRGADPERARRYGMLILDELARDNVSSETAVFLQQLYDLIIPIISLQEELRLACALGQVYQALGQLQQAAGWYRRYLELAQQLDDRSAWKSAYFELGELALVINDYREAIACAQSGLAVAEPALEMERVRLAASGHRLLGAALAMEGRDLGSAEAHLREAAEALRLSGNLGGLCATLFELGNIAAQHGHLQQALEHYAEAAVAARRTSNHYFLALAQNNYAYHSLLRGDLETARQALAEGKAIAETYELLGALLHLSSTQGELHLYCGEWEEARESFRQGLALAEELGNLERQAGYRAGLALAARCQRQLQQATALLSEALALIDGYGYQHLRTRIQLWLAEIWLVRDQPGEAWPYLSTALETARAQQRRLLLIRALCLQAWYLATQASWQEAEVLLEQARQQALELALPLEVARVQAMWAQVALRLASMTHLATALLADAQQVLAAHQARGELALLPLSATS